MAKKSKLYSEHIPGPKKRTSIGQSIRSRPKNKHKRRNFKKYRGQGEKMTAMFVWRDESGAPCIIVKNALDHNGCDNLIKQLKGKTEPGTHIEQDGSGDCSSTNKETQMFHGLMILTCTT